MGGVHQVSKNRNQRKCHECGNTAWHEDDITPEVCCGICGSQDTRLVRKQSALSPTPSQIHSACLSYRHDYGILDEYARASLRITAHEWFEAWRKTGAIQP
jgi:hypothetical protein